MINPSVRTRLYDLFDKPIEKQFVNRTGATLAKGDIVSVDLTGSDGDVETYTGFDPDTDADTAHPFANVISVATAHLKGWVFAVAAESIEDNATGRFYLRGVIDVELADSDTSDVDAGDRITPTNAQTYASLGVDAQVTVGIALEDAVSSGPTTKKCIFDGYQLSTTGAATG